MRYDTPVYFQRITPGEYDPDTGNYADDIVEETLRYASVMNTGEDTLRLVYDGRSREALQSRFRTTTQSLLTGSGWTISCMRWTFPGNSG